jgi:pyrroloquinoline quinone (PQQ) biosynthesis protein C
MALSSEEFVTQLRAYIAQEDKKPALGSDFYQSILKGELSRDQLKAWALNLFYVTGQHIRAFGGIFLNTGLAPLDQKIRRHIVENLMDEETVMGRGDDAHWMLSMRLAKALGATDEEVMSPVVAKEAVDYVNWIIELGRREYGLITLAALSIGGETRSDGAGSRRAEQRGGRPGLPACPPAPGYLRPQEDHAANDAAWRLFFLPGRPRQ